MRLLDHLALRADPLRPHWLANLSTLLNQYFRRDPRPNVRTKALAILSEVYNRNRSEGRLIMTNDFVCDVEAYLDCFCHFLCGLYYNPP